MPKIPKARAVSFSNLDKVFFPRTGFTKGEMIKYYLDVSAYLLPHLRKRPVTLIRFPDGVDGEKFYEKNAPRFTPGWVKTCQVRRRHEDGSINYILIDNAATLAWCANIAALELHPFLHRVPHLDRPTHVVFDFDPGEGSDMLTCAAAAFRVKDSPRSRVPRDSSSMFRSMSTWATRRRRPSPRPWPSCWSGATRT